MTTVKNINLGPTQVIRIYLGDTEVTRAYLGDTLVWDKAKRELITDFKESKQILGWFFGSSYTFTNVPTTAFDFVATMKPASGSTTPIKCNLDLSALNQGSVTVAAAAELSGLKQYLIKITYKYWTEP